QTAWREGVDNPFAPASGPSTIQNTNGPGQRKHCAASMWSTRGRKPPMLRAIVVGFMSLVMLVSLAQAGREVKGSAPSAIRVGAAAAELDADDPMIIGGGIGPGFVKGQEGKLRAVA